MMEAPQFHWNCLEAPGAPDARGDDELVSGTSATNKKATEVNCWSSARHDGKNSCGVESDWAARRERTEKLGSKIDNLLIGAEHRARRVGRGRSGSELPPSGHSRSSALLHPSPSVRPSASFDPPSPLPSRPLGLPAVLDDEDSRVRSGGNCSVAASTSRTRDRSATDPRRSSHWP